MNILAIGAHPDDIEFGCGGTMIKCAKADYSLYFFVLTKGGCGGEISIRQKEQDNVAKFLKVKKIIWGNYSDTEIPLTRKLIRDIERVVKITKPDMVLFNYPQDTHQDHRILAEAAISATRFERNVLYYEVPSSFGFEPAIFTDITDCMEQKLDLLKLHTSQVHKTRISKLTILESAQSCAIFRGSQARVKYAEGFKALRMSLDI